MSAKLRLLIIKIIFTVGVFFLTLKIMDGVINRPDTVESADVNEATFPVVTLKFNGTEINRLYGYSGDMDVSSLQGTVYVTDSTRYCEAVIETYGSDIGDVFYEVRTKDGENLIEKTLIETVSDETDGKINLSFNLKDLIDYDTEYMLGIIVNTGGIKEIKYYSRVYASTDEELLNLDKHLEFVQNISLMTFEKNTALTEYLESKKDDGTQTLSYVDINSPFEYVVWEGLDITEKSTPVISVYDIHSQTASISLDYEITVNGESGEKKYLVRENYFTRYSGGDMYLIDYRRTADMIFEGKEEEQNGNVIDFSYTDSDITLKESDGGSAIAFINTDRLFVWQLTENRLTEVISFYDDDTYGRIKHDAAKINILRIDDDGNVVFSVTGYFGRGSHEGEVGTAVYEFDSVYNYITEYIFISSRLSEEVLMHTAGSFAYFGGDGTFYTLQGEELYAIGLYTGETMLLLNDAPGKNISASESGKVMAWQNDAADMTKGITVLNLNDASRHELNSDNALGLRLMSFIGDDIVYGEISDENAEDSLTGDTVYPCENVYIADAGGSIIAEYSSKDTPVISAESESTRVILKRVSKGADGKYVSADDDRMVLSEETEEDKNSVVSIQGEYGLTKAIQIAYDVNLGRSRRFTSEITGNIPYTPDITSEMPIGRYITYDHGKADGVYTEAADAVTSAYELCGQVLDENGAYIYYRGNMTRRNQIMTLTYAVEDVDYGAWDTLTACLSAILEYEGSALDVKEALSDGESAAEILSSAMPAARVLDLTGAPLRAMTYYLDLMCDYPVLAAVSETRYVLLIGFNDTEIVLFDPGEPAGSNVYKITISRAVSLFEENGNVFITYVK